VENLTRRRLLQAGGGAVLAGATLPWLLSCGGGGAQNATTLKMTNDKVTWKDFFSKEADAGRKATGIGWSLNEFSDTNTYQASIRTAGATPKAPDLFTWWSGWLMKDIVDAGLAADLSSLWDKAGSAYSKDLRQAFTFNGKAWGAPLYFGYWATLYNKKVFDKYQLQPPGTWDEFLHVVDTLRANGVTPLGATIDGRWPTFIYFEEFLVRSDPNLYQNLMAGKAKYTDAGVVQAMQLWGSLIKAGAFTDPSSVSFGTGTNDFVNSFVQGKAAMVQIGTWYEPTLTAAGLKAGEDYDAFIWPTVKSGVPKAVIFESGPLVVAAHGTHQDQAQKSLEWFMSKDGQQEWNRVTGFTSARTDVPSSSPVDQRLGQTVKSGGYQLLNRYWEATPHQIVETAVDEFGKFMLHPDDPQSVLQAIQKQADSVWAGIR
jgi:multiple sugar transport system substrate-binding protein